MVLLRFSISLYMALMSTDSELETTVRPVASSDDSDAIVQGVYFLSIVFDDLILAHQLHLHFDELFLQPAVRRSFISVSFF